MASVYRRYRNLTSDTKAVFTLQNVREKLLHLSPERDLLHNRERVHGLGKNGRGLFEYKRRDGVRTLFEILMSLRPASLTS